MNATTMASSVLSTLILLPGLTAQSGYGSDYHRYYSGKCSTTAGASAGYYKFSNNARTAINEILLMSEDLQRMAVDRRPSDEIKRVAVEQGMVPLREDGLQKVRQGLTSLEEILRVVV